MLAKLISVNNSKTGVVDYPSLLVSKKAFKQPYKELHVVVMNFNHDIWNEILSTDWHSCFNGIDNWLKNSNKKG